MTCHLTRPVETHQKPRNGWDLCGTRQKHPHACPNCPIRFCCPHSLGWSCLHTLLLTLTLITCRCVPFSYEDTKYFTRLTLCVRSCIKSGVLYVLAWSELVKMLQNISHGSNLFAMCYPYICRSRQDSMSLLSQTFSLVILQITILHFNDSISGTSINWAPITWEMTQDGSARFPHKKTREKQRCARARAQKGTENSP